MLVYMSDITMQLSQMSDDGHIGLLKLTRLYTEFGGYTVAIRMCVGYWPNILLSNTLLK